MGGYVEGLNNLYHTKAKSDMAVDYSYLGAMEQMHLARTLGFFAKAGWLMEGLKPADRDKARRIITKAVLSTDMVWKC